jgi:4-carboxymuconolactone decarboxylase
VICGRLIVGHSAYCGMPAGMEAFRVADRVLNEMQEKGEMVRG